VGVLPESILLLNVSKESDMTCLWCHDKPTDGAHNFCGEVRRYEAFASNHSVLEVPRDYVDYVKGVSLKQVMFTGDDHLNIHSRVSL
jgi:hypothetical protein